MSFYSRIAPYYDELFSADPRVVHFLQTASGGAHTLLDIGCASGALSCMCAQNGFSVTGLDLDGEMIVHARERAATQNVSAEFTAGNMNDADSLFAGRKFDAVICTGNTIAHLDSVSAVNGFVQKVSVLLSTGGLFAVQLLNYEYILSKKPAELPLIENSFVKFERLYDYTALPKVVFTTKLFVKAAGESTESSVPLYPLTRRELENVFKETGFNHVDWFSDFAKSPVSSESFSLVAAAYV